MDEDEVLLNSYHNSIEGEDNVGEYSTGTAGFDPGVD